MVNGPEGDVLDWDAVDWRQAEDDVWRLRQRIFTASKAGDLKKVRSLQKLMLRSRSSALVSVRRVTEVNAGRKTAGVDGRIVLMGWEKAELASWLQHGAAAWRPRPVKRVFIPKPKLRVAWMPRPPLACAFAPILAAVSDYLGRVSGMAAPMRSKAWRCSLVGSARTGTVAGVPARRSSLRVRVPRWASSPRKLR